MSLDAIDTCILSSLQENGRMPLSEIARRAGVAPATVHERLGKLRKSGIVQGFCVRLDPRLLGFTVTALIHLRTGLAAEVGRTVEGLNAIPEVEEVHVVTGEYDLIIKVRARDTEHLQQLLVGRIHKVTGIARSATEVCMTSPLERLGPLVSPPAAPSGTDPARDRDAW